MPFTDPEFPAVRDSIVAPDTWRDKHNWSSRIEESVVDNAFWKRPLDIVDNPVLVSDGFSPEDVYQQSLGTCWFVSVLISMTLRPKLLEHVIKTPLNQSSWDAFNGGPFRFQFYHLGEWKEVQIDDLLPVNNSVKTDVKYNIAFTKSTDPREMWVSMVEKAYAKLHGGYENIHGGSASWAFAQLMGAVTSTYVPWEFHCDPTRMYNLVSSGKGFYAAASESRQTVVPLRNGLTSSHLYAVLSLHWVTLAGSRTLLVKIKNAYLGDGWTGQFRDGSSEWDLISEEEKQEMGYKNNPEDGIFFMQLHDFCDFGTSSFQFFVEATLEPDFDSDGIPDPSFNQTFHVKDARNTTIDIWPSKDSLFLVDVIRNLVNTDRDSTHTVLRCVVSSAVVAASRNVEEVDVNREVMRFPAKKMFAGQLNTYTLSIDFEGDDDKYEVLFRIYSQQPFEAEVFSPSKDASITFSAATLKLLTVVSAIISNL